MSNAHILPDSRASAGKQGVMMDWAMPDGTSVRVEASHVYCANCGKLYGLVPKENTSFTFWLCVPCVEKYGAIAGTFAQPDEEFMQSVVEEMTERFGRTLTAEEVVIAKDCGRLGTALEKLERESPFPVKK